MSDEAKKTILLVEDEAILAITEKMELEKYGYAVLTANSGEKAVSAVKSMPKIDLILMDINLGKGIDGTEAAEIILQSCDIPIVFLSSHSESEIVEKTEKITSYGYVVKNSSITVLDASIKMAFKLFYAYQDIKEKDKAVFREKAFTEAVFESIPGMLYVYDRRGNFILRNKNHEKMTGYSSEELSKLDLVAWHGSRENAAHVEAMIKEVHTNGHGEVEAPVITKTGKIMTMKLSGTSMELDKNSYFVGVGIDITEAQKAEEALKYSEELYKSILQASPDIIALTNMSGEIEMMSPKAFPVFGYNTDENIIGRSVTDFMVPLDRERANINLALMAQGQLIGVEEYKGLRKDGSSFDIEINGEFVRNSEGVPIQIVFIVRDISTRNRLQAKYTDSERLHRAILQTALDGYWLCDIEGHILDANDSYCRMSGYTKQELQTKNVSDISEGQSEEEIKNTIKQLFLYGSRRFEDTHRRRDGSIFEVEVSIQHQAFSGGRIVSFFRDITNQKMAEIELKQSQERFRFALEGSGLGDWDWNPKTNKVIRNKRWAEMLGYSEDEIDDTLALGTELQHPDDILRIRKDIQDHFEGLTDSYKIEYRMRMKDGKYKWIRDCGKVMERDEDRKPIRVCGTHADIDDQKRSEELISKSQSLLQSIMNSSPDVIVFALDRDYRYLAFNDIHKETIRQIWGKDIGVGMNMLDIIGEHDDRKKAKEAMDRALNGESFVISEEYGDEALSRQSWLDYWSPIKSAGGEIIGLTCYVLNNTAQKRSEAEISKLLAEKELVLKEVHHCIKNNMEMIRGLLSFQMSTVSDTSAIAALEDSVNRIQAMALLYDKLYRSADYAELPVRTYLPMLVDEVVANFSNSRIVKVQKCIDDFVLDAKRLQSLGIIINELLTNSMKYAFKGKEDGKISVLVKKVDNLVMATIQDDGMGFPESIDFESTTGFGLLLVKALSEQLKGKVFLERENGAKVSIEFEL